MLIECPECKKTISDKAKTCPHCGYPIGESLDDFNINSQKPKIGSFTVAFRGNPGSILGVVIGIGIFALIFVVAGILCLALTNYLYVVGAFSLAFGILLVITTIVYVSYFVHNSKNMSHNCIEYDSEKDKLVLCTLYGELIEIDVDDVIELKDNFFTDNMLLFTYRTKDNRAKKVKLGYCSNRDEIRANIRKIK